MRFLFRPKEWRRHPITLYNAFLTVMDLVSNWDNHFSLLFRVRPRNTVYVNGFIRTTLMEIKFGDWGVDNLGTFRWKEKKCLYGIDGHLGTKTGLHLVGNLGSRCESLQSLGVTMRLFDQSESNRLSETDTWGSHSWLERTKWKGTIMLYQTRFWYREILPLQFLSRVICFTNETKA
jgi:hypothetical protein